MGKLLDIQKSMFGAENLVSADAHWDEEHDYLDSETGESRTSRVHLHSTFIPVDERGQLNGKQFFSRKNMRALNQAVEEMTQQEYGVSFQTGAKKRSRQSVRELKDKSAAAVLEREAQVAAREEAVWCREAEAEYTAREKYDNDAEALAFREDAISRRESEIDDRAFHVGLRERKARADMDAARAAQEAADRQAKEQRELISLGRRAKAAQLSAPVTQRQQASRRRLPGGVEF